MKNNTNLSSAELSSSVVKISYGCAIKLLTHAEKGSHSGLLQEIYTLSKTSPSESLLEFNKYTNEICFCKFYQCVNTSESLTNRINPKKLY